LFPFTLTVSVKTAGPTQVLSPGPNNVNVIEPCGLLPPESMAMSVRTTPTAPPAPGVVEIVGMVAVGEAEGLALGEALGLGDGLAASVAVIVGVGDSVAVPVGVALCVGVSVAVSVTVALSVAVAVAVWLLVAVAVGVEVSSLGEVAVARGVIDWHPQVASASCACPPPLRPMTIATIALSTPAVSTAGFQCRRGEARFIPCPSWGWG
jgi:hypothetical protein